MNSLGDFKVRTKLFAAIAVVSVLSAAAAFSGMKVLVFCAMGFGIVVAALVSNGIGRRLKQLEEIAENVNADDLDRRIALLPDDEFGEIAASIRRSITPQKELVEHLARIAQGDFQIRSRATDDSLNKAVQLCAERGRALEQEVQRVTQAVKSGQLSERCRPESTQGAYVCLLEYINEMIDCLVRVPGKAIAVLTRVVEGDLTARLQGQYSGDHAKFQDAVNHTVKTLDGALTRVGIAAEQVSAASHQISSGSQSLSQKANDQASSIEEVSSSLHEVAAMTRQNSENAMQARNLSKVAEASVEAGVDSMKRLSEAIDRIKTSSDATAKIIKTIDEIAFQTNLLALNAAVEAARAGDAGKGFAVVAEEVRNLAMRSAEAAKNTANLIEESVKNSENGVTLNQEVLANLNDIYGQVKKVGAVMDEIADSSEQQTKGVEQVNGVIAQMNVLTQEVAANAEESASRAEELSSQAEELRSMVRAFTLSTSVNEGAAAPKPVRSPALSRNKYNVDSSSSIFPSAPSSGSRSVRTESEKMIPFDEPDSLALSDF